MLKNLLGYLAERGPTSFSSDSINLEIESWISINIPEGYRIRKSWASMWQNVINQFYTSGNPEGPDPTSGGHPDEEENRAAT